MAHVSVRTSTTRSSRILASSTHRMRFVLIACCLGLLPAAWANGRGYLEVRGGNGADGDGDVDRAAETSAEILQLPHAFRHQQHYSHRIEQAVNDFKLAQLQQLKERDKKSASASNDNNNNNQQSNYNNKDNDHIEHHQQLQELQQHHRRHEQHFHHELQQLQLQEAELLHQEPPEEEHHLRHHNRHHAAWEQRVFPPLRHQRHQQHQQQSVQQQQKQPSYNAAASTTPSTFVAVATTTTKTTETDLHATTEAAASIELAAAATAIAADNSVKLHEISTLNGTKPQRYFDRDPAVWPHTTRGPKMRHYYGDPYDNLPSMRKLRDRAGPRSDQLDDGGAAAEDGAVYNNGQHLSGQRLSLKLNAVPGDEDERVSDLSNAISKSGSAEDANIDDADDDYSYEDDSSDEYAEVNEFPRSAPTNEKIAVKRFTNPFKIFKSSASKRVEYYAQRQENVAPNYATDGGSDDAEASDDSEDFSSEKWNKIEHEHHLKQQQHQRELMALRAKHGGGGKFSSTTPTGGAKWQTNVADDAENIYSRYYIPGTLTRQKQEELGTMEAVQESRRSHAVKHKQNKALANAHVKQIISEATCRVPHRRIERIQRDPSKIYTPHCTVLHRCADDTGCCRSERQTCAPKRTKSVDLYFFVKSINDKRGSVERLTFVNHTECHCVDKSKQRPEEYGNANSYYGIAPGSALRRATILNCNCPKLYEKILQEDGFCRCDCSSGNSGCDWLKRGMEHFSMIDRKCILEGRCKPPTCEYGAYMKKHGRCPRREEQLSATLGGSSMSALTINSLSASNHH